MIGADGITVNLGGHTISGTNAAGSEGIANDGHAGVRILGSGRITDFRLNGVGVRKAPKSVVRGLTIRRIGAGGVEGEPVSAGIAVVDSPASKIVGNDVVNDVKAFQADGADILNSRGSLVRGNKLSHNSWNGLVLIESPRSRIAGNELDGNGNNGTEVNGGSDSVSVTRNAANGNTAVGIVLGAARNARVVRNIARGNDTGLFFFDLHDSVIEKNTANGQSHGHRAHRRSIRLARQSTHGQHRERESGYRDRGRRGQAGYLERQLAEERHCQQEQGPRHRSDCRLDRRRRQSRKWQRDSAAVRERRLLGLRHGCVEWAGVGPGSLLPTPVGSFLQCVLQCESTAERTAPRLGPELETRSGTVLPNQRQ